MPAKGSPWPGSSRLASTAASAVRALVAHLSDSGLLAPGLDQAAAADACWALTGPRLFLDPTTERGWPPDQYEAWLTRMLTANLLVSDPGLQGAYAGVFPACGHARDRGN